MRLFGQQTYAPAKWGWIMSFKWESKCWLSLLLSIMAIMLVVCTWTTLFPVAYNFVNPPPYEQYAGFEQPTRVVGFNYSISFIIKFIASSAILMLALFLLGWKRKYSSASYWISSIALSIIIPHIAFWIFLIGHIPYWTPIKDSTKWVTNGCWTGKNLCGL